MHHSMLQEKLASSRHVEDLKAGLKKRSLSFKKTILKLRLLKEAYEGCLVSVRLHEIDFESMRALKSRLCFWEPIA